MMDSMKNAVDSVTAAGDAATQLPDEIESILNDTLGDFENLFNNPNCDSGPNVARMWTTNNQVFEHWWWFWSLEMSSSISGEVLGYIPLILNYH